MKLVCPHCGSDEISCDASARWDVERQEWSITGYFDSKSCDSCGEESKYADEVALPLVNVEEWLYRRSQISWDSIWSYKGKLYQVNSLLEKNLSQDPDTGEWRPSVRYTTYPQNGLVFYRADTEWLRKFVLRLED